MSKRVFEQFGRFDNSKICSNEGMGTNRRYAHHYDKLMEDRIEKAASRPRPLSLSRAEVDPENDPIRTPSRAPTVVAWVRFPERAVRVSGFAIAWTSRAVQLEWTDEAQRLYRCWVWASAVRRA